MKKYITIAAAMLVMAACSNNKADVTELSDDSIYRPGMTVDTPTVLDFSATWCGPCQAFKPVFHSVAEENPDIRFITVDIDKMEQTSAAFGVSAVPTIVFLGTDGSESRTTGYMDADQLSSLLKSLK